MVATSAHPVLVVDFGAQYAQLIARRVREAHVYSEIVPHTMSVADMLAKNPAAIVLLGGPASVYERGAPTLDPALLSADVPVLASATGSSGNGGGAWRHRGTHGCAGVRLNRAPRRTTWALFADTPTAQRVWMSHGDAVTEAPDGFAVLATSEGAPVAAFEDRARRLAGVQFHPEVRHSDFGQAILEAFLTNIAEAPADWTMTSVIDGTGGRDPIAGGRLPSNT